MRCNVKKATSIVLIFSLLLMSGSPALADDSDIFGKDIQPNVMLLFDTSESMGANVPSIPYDPMTKYPGSLTSTVVYQQPKPKDTPTVYKNSIAEVPDQNARNALSTIGYWVGKIGGSSLTLRMGNYINYWNCQSCSGLEKKIDVAKRVVTDLIRSVDGVRFGVMRLRSEPNNHGQVVAPIGTPKQTIIDLVNAMQMESGTPLGEQMYDAGQYFKGQKLIDGTTWTSPIQLECQPNFIVMFTDGAEDGSLKVESEAGKRYTEDHASWLTGKQNVIVHTVAFGLAGLGTAIDNLIKTAKKGGGNFYQADDAVQLQVALLDAINKIVAGTFTFASPVIPTTSTTGSTRAYVASFQSDVSRPFWRGFLKAYQRGANGEVPVDANGVPLDSALIWEAGERLSQILADNRTIFTFVSGKKEDFTKANAAITGAMLGAGGSIYQFTDKDGKVLTREFTKPIKVGVFQLDVKLATDVPGAIAPPDCGVSCYAYDPNGDKADKVPPATLGYVGGLSLATYGNGTKLDNLFLLSGVDRNMIIDFVRGIDAFDEDLDGISTEERDWKLGDIFHSSPVLVTPPFSPSADASYVAFKQSNVSRPTILIAGANDGMLHAFNESDGMELWAFIPPDLLGNLKDLTVRAAQHPFYVDASPIAADIKIGLTWKTIVVFGERRGGKSYHALDITNTTSPIYLWSFTDAKIAETWSEPAIGKMKMNDGTERFVAFVGGGYDTAQNNASGKALFVIDLATGQKLWEYYNDGSLDDRQYMNFSLAASPTVVDLNHDGYIDRVYIGDVGGQLWKFDVSAPVLTGPGGLVANLTGKRLFEADFSQKNPPDVGEYYPAQAIYTAPSVAFDDYGDLWVYFGTGDRNHPNNNSQNNFYGIKDNTTMANDSVLTEKALEDVTSANKTAVQGWFFRLTPDEKVLSTADIFNKIVFFSSFTPTNVVQCGSGGGNAKLYAVQALTGYAAIDWNTGTALASSDSKKVRSKAIGSGIASKPIVVINYTGPKLTASVVTATTNEQLPSNPAPAPTSLKRLIYWREVF
jgi:type IV pilus assembly protein PilY1